MAGTLKHRHQTALPNTGADVSATVWNDSLVMAGGSDGQIPVRDSGQADGWQLKGLTAIAPDSVSVINAAAAASYNLSTLGVYDWLAPNAQTTTPRQIANGTLHEKAAGGFLSDSFMWVEAGVGATVFTQNITPQMTTTATDDCASSALSNAVGGQGIFTTAGSFYGFRLSVPAFGQQRTLSVYTEHFSCNITASCYLLGASGLTQATLATTNGGAGAGASEIWTITYTAGLGGVLTVTFLLSQVLGVNQSPNVKFGFAYLA